ncbi:MAG: zinc-ribbon domain-containing protein [Gemmataceae bacterium]|nr:zinc-ribbon domain-containing protein [Gemmataceae bacterium]
MADFKILCPACTAVLSSKKPIPNGKKITCPNCKKPFVAATADAGSDSGSLEFEWSPPDGGGVIQTPSRGSAPRSSERTVARAPHRAASSGSKAMLWILMLLFLVLALGGGGVGVYFYLKTEELQTAQERDKKKKAKEKTTALVKNDDKDNKKPEAARDDKANKTTKAISNKPETESKQAGPAQKEDGGGRPKNADKAQPKERPFEWLEYRSEPGAYVIQFPTKPTDRRERDDDLIFHEMSAEINGFEYSVVFHQLKKDDVMPVKERLAKLADEYKDVTILRKEVEFEQIPMIPAIEVTMYKNGKKDVAVERIIVYRDHVYQLTVTGNREKIGPDQVAQFMRSFRFVGEPRGGFLDLAQTQGVPPQRQKK